MKRTENHNTLAPSFDSITTVEQMLFDVPLIPEANGDETSFRASLDLSPVWKGSMTRCRRNISSPDLEGWTVDDEGQLEREGRVVFSLQNCHPFTGSSHEWTSGKVRIKAPWAGRADTAEHLVNSEFRPIYRLRLWSGVLQSFALKTEFARI